MRQALIDKVNMVSDYILENNKNVFDTSLELGISKRTINRYINEYLPKIDKAKYDKISKVVKSYVFRNNESKALSQAILNNAERLSFYIIENKCTLKEAASNFGLDYMKAYSAINKLKSIDENRYNQVISILGFHKAVKGSKKVYNANAIYDAIINKNLCLDDLKEVVGISKDTARKIISSTIKIEYPEKYREIKDCLALNNPAIKNRNEMVLKEAVYYLKNNISMLEVGRKFKKTKYEIYRDLKIILKEVDSELYNKVQARLKSPNKLKTNVVKKSTIKRTSPSPEEIVNSFTSERKNLIIQEALYYLSDRIVINNVCNKFNKSIANVRHDLFKYLKFIDEDLYNKVKIKVKNNTHSGKKIVMDSTNLTEERKERIIKEAIYYLENPVSIIETANAFNVSKDIISRDLKEYLKVIDLKMYNNILAKIELNKHRKKIVKNKNGTPPNVINVLSDVRKERVIKEADYYLNEVNSFKQVSSNFNLPISTIHRDLTFYLRHLDFDKYELVANKIKSEKSKVKGKIKIDDNVLDYNIENVSNRFSPEEECKIAHEILRRQIDTGLSVYAICEELKIDTNIGRRIYLKHVNEFGEEFDELLAHYF